MLQLPTRRDTEPLEPGIWRVKMLTRAEDLCGTLQNQIREAAISVQIVPGIMMQFLAFEFAVHACLSHCHRSVCVCVSSLAWRRALQLSRRGRGERGERTQPQIRNRNPASGALSSCAENEVSRGECPSMFFDF